MTKYSLKQEDTTRSIRLLMFLRVVVVTFLLGIAAFIQIKEAQQLVPGATTQVFSIIAVTYILSMLYVLLLKKTKGAKLDIYVQALFDIALITVLVYVTGGIKSIYSVLYQLVIVYSTLFLARKGGLIAASASGIFYGLLLDFEYYGIIPAYGHSIDNDLSAGYVLSRIFIHIASFYIVAFLVSFVVEQEKRSRSLLTEKESEFDQLDLLYKSIIENVNAGIVTIDLMGHIKSFNKAAEEISGFSFEEVEGKKIDTVFPGFFETIKIMKAGKDEGKKIARGEIVIQGIRNRDLILGFSVSSLIDNEKNVIGNIVIFQDLTAAKEMEKEIEKSKNMALIGEMAAGLAHEIRNPLTALSGSIQLLKSNLDLEKTDERLMQIVLRGREQLEKLISNFLLLTRPTLNERKPIDIHNIIDEVIESVRYDPDWHQNIEVEKITCQEANIFGNRMEFKQMLWNLVLNAVQAMPDGGKLKIVTKQMTSGDGGGHLGLWISDTGCGIEKDKETKIFTPFYTTKERGTGLGLAIASRVAESHGGQIKIESEVGKGTSCELILPREKKLMCNDAGNAAENAAYAHERV